MTVREYTGFDADQIRRLYAAAGWTAYTQNMPALEEGFRHSLLVLAAYEDGELLGILRAVGDGFTVVFIQDILVFPEARRKGAGTALVKALLDRYPLVRQIQLTADDAPDTAAFYGSLGFTDLSAMGCRGYMKYRRPAPPAPDTPACTDTCEDKEHGR